MNVFHISRPSTVQSFILLGYREFGIGSMEQGWIFIGTLSLFWCEKRRSSLTIGARHWYSNGKALCLGQITIPSFLLICYGDKQAFDLGLNCDSSKWKMHGHELFSAEETQTRRQIWWACVMTDRYGSVYMGTIFASLRCGA